MRLLIGGVATALLAPLWFAMSGGLIPWLNGDGMFGVPKAILFVLAEMAVLVGLCWAAMKVVARESGCRSKRSADEQREPKADH